MADRKQLEILGRGVEEWNFWREVSSFKGNLSSADLVSTYLREANLRDTDLSEANLSYTDLSVAILSNADCRNAILRNAKLIATQALNTNFEGATLTGACIQDWHINSNTNLKNVTCEYVYLRFPYRDRRPHNPNRTFAPGEFSRLYQIVQDSLSLYFKDGVDWQAMAYSFQQIVATDGTPLNIRGMEQTGDGVIIKVDVPDRLDKGKVEGDFWEGYKFAQAAIESEQQAKDALIAAKDGEIVRQENTIAHLLTIVSQQPVVQRITNITGNTIQGSAYTEELKGSGYTGGDNTTNASE
ncbi:MAG: pentapeptide repeat-containing protein [Cyanobacteria bacterium P01_E01_bin.42]